MKNDSHGNIEAELEARLMSLVHGEASEFEKEELERLMQERPEVKAWKDQLEKIHRLLEEGEKSLDEQNWKLTPARREEVLADLRHAQAADEKRRAQSSKRAQSHMIIGIAACFAVTLFLAGLILPAIEYGYVTYEAPTIVSYNAAIDEDFAAAKVEGELVKSIYKDKAAIPALESKRENSNAARKPPSSSTSKVIASNSARPQEILVPPKRPTSRSAGVPPAASKGNSQVAQSGKKASAKEGEKAPASPASPIPTRENSQPAAKEFKKDQNADLSDLAAGNRSGDSAISRNSMDAILNNPDRTASGGVDLEKVMDAPGQSTTAQAGIEGKDAPADFAGKAKGLKKELGGELFDGAEPDPDEDGASEEANFGIKDTLRGRVVDGDESGRDPFSIGDSSPESNASDAQERHAKPEYFASDAQRLTTQKLKETKIPIIDFEDVTLDEAVEFLNQRSRELDSTSTNSNQKGVKMEVRRAKVESDDLVGGLGAGSDPSSIRIKSLKLKDVPIATAMQYIADQTKTRYKVDDKGKVTFLPLTAGEEDEIQTKSIPLSAEEFEKIRNHGMRESTGAKDPFAVGNDDQSAIMARTSAQSIFEERGTKFNDNSSISYLPGEGRLIVRNTPSQLELVEAIVGEAKKKSELITKVFELKPDTVSKLSDKVIKKYKKNLKENSDPFDTESGQPIMPRYSMQGMFQELGVVFPYDSSMTFVTEEQKILLKGTPEQYEAVKKIIDDLEKPDPDQEAPPETGEISAAEKPDSTFSLNVSDVSFKLAQAALEKGQRPEAEKIRVEEFVNAFDYGDSKPSQAEKVACVLEQSAHPSLMQRNLLRVSLSTAALGRQAGTPLRLTVLLDRSGSMEREDRAESVRQAFRLLAAQLTADDEVTLIGFARQPHLLAARVKGNECGKLADVLAANPSEGGTNLEAALQLGFEQAKQNFLAEAQNRIILLTDGAANLGDAKPERLAKIVESMRAEKIAFDACGVGAAGLNDEILESLTRKGDGRYYFLNRPEDADDGFAKRIAGALRPAAKNVKVQVIFNPKRVGNYQLYGFEKHLLKKEDFRNDAVDAAELAAEENGVAMYHFQALPEGEGEVGTVSVRFLDTATNEMVERLWTIPYVADALPFEEAKSSLQLAGAALFLGEKLRGSSVGESIQWPVLQKTIQRIEPEFREQKRFQELGKMIEQAKAQ